MTFRRGFTLVELLVAMGIVLLLASMTFVTLRGVLASSKATRTQTTILKVNAMLKQARIEFDKVVRSGDLPPLPIPSGVLAEDTVKFVSRKLKYKYAFPQRFEDLVGIDGVPGQAARPGAAPIDDDSDGNIDWEAGRPDLGEFLRSSAISGGAVSDDGVVARLLAEKLATGVFDPTTHRPETESSEILYILFSEGSVYGVSTADAGEFSANELADTDDDGLMEIVDAWGNPLRFYRWPTRLVIPESGIVDSTNPNMNPYWDVLSNTKFKDLPSKYDQFDPTGTMTNQIRRLGTAFFSEGKSNTALQNVIHTPNTYQTFLIVSAGADGLLGLEEPTNAAELGHLGAPLKSIRDAVDAAATVTDKETIIYDSVLSDNITNLQLDTP